MLFLNYFKGVKIKQFVFGLVIVISTITSAYYLAMTEGELKIGELPSDPEPAFNWWTVLHITGVIGYYLCADSLKKTKIIIPSVVLTLIFLVEIMEWRYTPDYWMFSWKNNVWDIIVGIGFCFIIMWILAKTSTLQRKNKRN